MKNHNSNTGIITHDTELVQAVSQFSRTRKHQYDLQDLMERAQQAGQFNDDLDTYDGLIRDRLSEAIFVGHINTDLDSVAGAIGAAALFGGTPAISEPAETLNGEISFALKNCGIETPRQFDSIEGAEDREVVLVDHTEETQMVPSIFNSPTRATRIIGTLDHHALAKTFFTSKPIFMDLRPWGSVSTIITVLYVNHKKFLPKPIALLLLHAILSDTLNLRSVTTTEADRGTVALLASYVDISDTRRVEEPGFHLNDTAAYQETEIDLLAKRQFQAKTDWIVALGAYEMVRGDQKDFSSGPWKFGISVLEVNDSTKVLECAEEILLELRLLKKEKGLTPRLSPTDGDTAAEQTTTDADSPLSPLELNRSKELDFAFLFVVNIVAQESILLIPGGRELALAREAFLATDDTAAEGTFLTEACPGIVAPGATIKSNETAMYLPKGYVSRKAQFAPALFAALEQNFSYQAKGPVSLTGEQGKTYSAADTEQVLQAIEDAREAKPAAFADKSNPETQRVIAAEGAVEQELLAREKALTANADGNWYDENGRIRRSYR